ncbi:hypothetical protein PHMEG_00012643 [Phytophthora megakarya]|uniref:Uncharacterized protein n=1 Tax=Phytophthora megakarya TaxID=4795 RepID=A0A225WAT4_9STRA|nr:hypothetical protein PHMEG_00012643 [Phytophthora megakarya]
MSARLTRRRTQKADKRRRVKALAVRRGREERAEEAEHRSAASERQARRRQDADALQQHWQQGNEHEAPSGGAASLNLVQQERHVDGERQGVGVKKKVNLDSGAKYTVAGTEWMMYGDKVDCAALVAYGEDIGGFLLGVVGVWQFEMRSAFDE